MAISALADWNCRGDGDDANGGFYVPGAGTDYSLQASAQLAVTDCVTNGTTTVTSATGGFTSAMVNNAINVGGTIRQITAYTNTNTITVDALIAAATGQTARVGGAIKSPAVAFNFAPASNVVNLRNDTEHVISNTSIGVANGRIQVATQAASGNRATRLRGYSNSYGDGGRATIKANITSSNLIVMGTNVQGFTCENIIFDGDSKASISCVANVNGGNSIYKNCQFKRFTNSAYVSAATNHVITFVDCEFTLNTSASVCLPRSGSDLFYRCRFHANTSTAVTMVSAGGTLLHCLVYANTGATTDGVQTNGNLPMMIGCSVHGNGRYGINIGAGAIRGVIIDCISYGNGTSDWNWQSTNFGPVQILKGLAGGAASFPSSTLAGLILFEDYQQAAQSPFTNPASGDLSLNAYGRGALAVAETIGLTTSYPFKGATTPRVGGVRKVTMTGGMD